jgi:hypothetical protein
MPEETFKLQADAVRHLMHSARRVISKEEEKHLRCAIRNLEQLENVRQYVIDCVIKPNSSCQADDELVTKVIHLLHLPASA